MLAGLNAALLLLGLWAPVHAAGLPALHGMLMVLGFLGTLISLERAVALRAGWGFLAPVLLGAGALALLTPAPAVLGQLLLVNGTTVLCAVYVQLWRRSQDTTVAVQLLGAVLALLAAALWIRVDVIHLVALLSGFIVTTIAAERVELARISLPPRAEVVVLGLVGVVALGAATQMIWPVAGALLFGLALVALAGYLGWHDVARRLIRARGLPRFAAAAMLAGYLWLASSGLLWVAGGPMGVPAWYDLVVHGVFLGFGMSMVLAHAPVILPAVLKIALPYHPVLWLPLVVLHTGMMVRMTGMVMQVSTVWQIGGVLTIAALILVALSATGLAVTAPPKHTKERT